MPQTAGSNFPMTAASPSGQGANKQTVIPIDTTETEMRHGDVLVVVAATRHVRELNTADGRTAAQIIIGVANLPGTGEVSVSGTIDPLAQPGPDRSANINVVNVSLALPGAMFTANVIEADNDQTGDADEDLRLQTEISESTQGFACVDITSDAGDLVAFTMQYASPQYLVASTRWQHGRNAGVGIVNPRVQFCFLTEATVFGSSVPIA